MRIKRTNFLTGSAFLACLFVWGLSFAKAEEPKEDYTSKVPMYTFPETLDEQIKALKTNPLLQRFKQSRRDREANPYRPIYHFINPEDGLNDPNGLSYWKGNWHLFYQFCPPEEPGRVHWGHAISKDLIHWKDLPIAIYPNPEYGCWSGAVYIEEDRAIACYFGHKLGTMVATSSDPLLLNWTKVNNTAVIPFSDTPKPYNIFDACIWKEGNLYYFLSAGSQAKGELGTIRPAWYLFKSDDLSSWDYVHQFVEDDYPSYIGDDGACPYFWPIGDQSNPDTRRHILIHFSHSSGGKYLVGKYDTEKQKFYVKNGAHFNHGPVWPGAVHAPSACPDGQGGIVAIFNMNPGKPMGGCDQIMTLPYQLNLMENDKVSIKPYPAVESLRYDHVARENIELPKNQEIVLDGIQGKSMELRLSLKADVGAAFTLKVFRSPDSEEYTAVNFYRYHGYPLGKESWIEIDSSHSSVEPCGFRPAEKAGIVVDPEKPVDIRVFIDRCVIEVFVNETQMVAERVYPSREDSIGVSVESRGKDSVLTTLNAWQMQNIYESNDVEP